MEIVRELYCAKCGQETKVLKQWRYGHDVFTDEPVYHRIVGCPKWFHSRWEQVDTNNQWLSFNPEI